MWHTLFGTKKTPQLSVWSLECKGFHELGSTVFVDFSVMIITSLDYVSPRHFDWIFEAQLDDWLQISASDYVSYWRNALR